VQYLSRGFSIIPLKPRSKEPLIKWEEYQKRQPTLAEISTWFSNNANLNLGIVTGSVSNLAVIDVDGPEGQASIRALGYTSNISALTGKGKQLFYKCGVINICNAVRIRPGIDVRGEGGYVVASPSIHPNGRRYVWTSPISQTSVNALPMFPTGLLQIKSLEQPENTRTTNNTGWIKEALEGMRNGNIDTTLHRICSRLRADNYSADDARILLEPHAARAGATPGHLQDKIDNVWSRYEPRDYQQRQLDGASVGPVRIHTPVSSRDEYAHIKAKQGTTPEYTTGYPTLDQKCKGLRRQEIFTVAARTGVGKTNWLLGPARHLNRQGYKVLMFTTEMSFDAVWDRYISGLRPGESFEDCAFHVCDEFAPNLERIEEALKLVQPDVFIFDHINHMGEEREVLGAFMRGLKMLATKFNCPAIVSAQLNRHADWVENGERVTPRLSMIKGSGTIEQISANVLLLSEIRVGPDQNDIAGNLDKARYGEKGPVNFALRKNPYLLVEVD